MFKDLIFGFGDFVDRTDMVRVIIMNFITAFIISFVACYFLSTIHLTDVIYIGNIFGIYFLSVYGIEVLIEADKLPNNYKRFILAIMFIFLFDILFVLVMPLIFGADVFVGVDYLTLVFNNARFDLVLNSSTYLAIFGLLMLIFNIILYRFDKKKYGVYNELQ